MREAQIYKRYVEAIGQGDMSREEAAEMFKVHKSTATYHLERAVAEGCLERFYSWTANNQTGWVYRKPGGHRSMYEVVSWVKSESGEASVIAPVFDRE